MAEVFLYRLVVIPILEGQNRKHMAKVMQAGIRQTNEGYQALIIVVDRTLSTMS